ncbi:hypothetical protein O3M35_011998 [Rhynocoris fuscipes]|uniref:Cilia- and flagella-associated protein 58 central coiled coil domain-containing protein n=1 Tax=Rhynocoris fuscipes TaxID=488301 RepID=A0AAW1CYT2_9HEMI
MSEPTEATEVENEREEDVEEVADEEVSTGKEVVDHFQYKDEESASVTEAEEMVEEEEEGADEQERKDIVIDTEAVRSIEDVMAEQLKKSQDEVFNLIMSHLPPTPRVLDFVEKTAKTLEEVKKLPESLIPAGVIETLSEGVESVQAYKKAHDLCMSRNRLQNELIYKQEKIIQELKDSLQNRDEKLAESNEKLENFERKLDAYYLREHELQEELELHMAEVKHLNEEMKKRDEIQADIDDEIGTSGRAREAYARQKQKLKEQMNAVECSLLEMKQDRDKALELHKNAVIQIDELRKEIMVKNDILLHREKVIEKIDCERNDMKRAISGSKKIFKLIHNSFMEFENHIVKLEQANFAQAAQIDGLLKKSTEIFKQNIQYTIDAAKCKADVDELVKAYGTLFSFLQSEEKKIRLYLRQIRDLQSRLASVNRRFSKAILEKRKAVEEKEVMIGEFISYEKDIKGKEQMIHNLTSKLNTLHAEQQRHILLINKLRNENKNAEQKVDDSFVKLSTEKSVQSVQSEEINALKRSLQKSNAIRKRLLADNTALMQKIEDDAEEIRIAKSEIYNMKIDFVKIEKEQKNLIRKYNKLVKEKNILQGDYVECKTQLRNEEGKVKLVNWQVQYLKEEFKAKDLAFRNKDIETRRTKFAKKRLEIHYNKARNKYVTLMKNTGGKNYELIECQKKLAEAHRKIIKLDKTVEKHYIDMATLKNQLDRRVSEITSLNERQEVLTSLLSRGEAHYNQRIEDIRLLKLEIIQLRREKQVLQKGFENNADLRGEIYFLHKELSEERQRCQALQEQLENPLNYHRWRMLEGTDPDKKELIDKILILQRRLQKANEDIALGKNKMDDLQALYDNLKAQFENVPTLEELAQINEIKTLYRKKCEENKGLESQLIAFERELRDYKYDIEELKKQLNQAKKQYLDLKVQNDRRKMKMQEAKKIEQLT